MDYQNEYDNSYTDCLVHKNVAVKVKYGKGVKLLEEKVNEIREIFNEMPFRFEDHGMKCLSDTVRNGIPHCMRNVFNYQKRLAENQTGKLSRIFV